MIQHVDRLCRPYNNTVYTDAQIAGLSMAIIRDGAVETLGASGEPDFRALLHGRTRGACVYAFDLLEWRGRDISEQPLVQRKAQLEEILKRGASRPIRFNESFPDANALLAECARRERRAGRKRTGPQASQAFERQPCELRCEDFFFDFDAAEA